MTGKEIRKKFLDYFADRGHTVVESSALVPKDDPTLLFTNAGMVQFKRVFTGEEKRKYVRATTSQRCVRAGGKHNDLENVGYTARHHTFFEMLGNFSFGDYFKEDAIHYGWEFLTKVIGLPTEKMWISVFEDDDEAYAIWEKIEDVPEGRIVRLGEKDNFWAMGDTGPCGPCSEIHIDQGPEVGCGRADCKVGCDCDRYLELWNLVFMQFERSEDGKLTPLPRPSIDTGMGLERIAAVVQGVHSNYDSDLFTGLINKIAEISKISYGEDSRRDTAMKVIADHSRATAFLVADGVLPANEGRGYVLRRIMRRAIRFGRFLGLTRPFMSAVTAEVIAEMAQAYPHLLDARELLNKVVHHEEERFLETLDHGLVMLEEEIDRMKTAGEAVIGGEFIFKLYDTYGFPVDIVRDIGLDGNMEIDEDGFNRAMAEQREQSRKSWKGSGLAEKTKGMQELLSREEKTDFVGYERWQASSTIKEILSQAGELVTEATGGDRISIVCGETPFYAESGGQVGDQGEIVASGGRARVLDTVSIANGLVLHQAKVVEGRLIRGAKVELKVGESRRRSIAANHTATHLLQAALKEVLGEHVKQSGSLVTPDRLRFDFTHFSPLTYKEIRAVEKRVNEEIRANSPLQTTLLGRDEAIQAGATALFGEKYGETVRMVSLADFSRELCGGTHVAASGEIGLMKITTETGIAAGIRRIEAVTGAGALELFQKEDAVLANVAELLRSTPAETVDRIKNLQARQKEMEKEISLLNARLSLSSLDEMINSGTMVEDVKVVAGRITLDSPKTMREVGDRVRDRLGSGVAVLGGVLNDKVSLLA
ncbi:MAG: alanine--tRNA ligase, partial [Desulfobulbaceae bacterium]|nr:alanine--tRNA ligase [Desulfobulbaceae bacterium]